MSSPMSRSSRRSCATATRRLRLHTKALDTELLRKRLRARGDCVPQLVGLEQDGFAAQREHLALEPLVAADGKVAYRRAVSQQASAALDRPARDLLVVEELRGARVAQPRRLESLARLE